MLMSLPGSSAGRTGGQHGPSDLPVRRDGLLGHGTQVALQEVPDVDAGSVVLDEKHCWPGRGPLQAGDGAARGAEAPLQHRPLGRQLVEPDAPVAAAGLRAGNQITALLPFQPISPWETLPEHQHFSVHAAKISFCF